MKIIKRILLFICGTFITSTGFTFLAARIAIAMGGEVRLIPFIRVDLILTSVLCLIFGGIVMMAAALTWTDEKGGE